MRSIFKTKIVIAGSPATREVCIITRACSLTGQNMLGGKDWKITWRRLATGRGVGGGGRGVNRGVMYIEQEMSKEIYNKRKMKLNTLTNRW